MKVLMQKDNDDDDDDDVNAQMPMTFWSCVIWVRKNSYSWLWKRVLNLPPLISLMTSTLYLRHLMVCWSFYSVVQLRFSLIVMGQDQSVLTFVLAARDLQKTEIGLCCRQLRVTQLKYTFMKICRSTSVQAPQMKKFCLWFQLVKMYG